jgi:hypothetical protein
MPQAGPFRRMTIVSRSRAMMCPVTAASPPTLIGVTALRCCATLIPDAFTTRALEETDGFALAGIEQLSGKPK